MSGDNLRSAINVKVTPEPSPREEDPRPRHDPAGACHVRGHLRRDHPHRGRHRADGVAVRRGHPRDPGRHPAGGARGHPPVPPEPLSRVPAAAREEQPAPAFDSDRPLPVRGERPARQPEPRVPPDRRAARPDRRRTGARRGTVLLADPAGRHRLRGGAGGGNAVPGRDPHRAPAARPGRRPGGVGAALHRDARPAAAQLLRGGTRPRTGGDGHPQHPGPDLDPSLPQRRGAPALQPDRHRNPGRPALDSGRNPGSGGGHPGDRRLPLPARPGSRARGETRGAGARHPSGDLAPFASPRRSQHRRGPAGRSPPARAASVSSSWHSR